MWYAQKTPFLLRTDLGKPMQDNAGSDNSSGIRQAKQPQDYLKFRGAVRTENDSGQC